MKIIWTIIILAFFAINTGSAAPAPRCRECDLTDISDTYCRSDRESCIQKPTPLNTALNVAMVPACIFTTGGSGCPSLWTSIITGRGPMDYTYEMGKIGVKVLRS